jgi:hypothetical protein
MIVRYQAVNFLCKNRGFNENHSYILRQWRILSRSIWPPNPPPELRKGGGEGPEGMFSCHR